MTCLICQTPTNKRVYCDVCRTSPHALTYKERVALSRPPTPFSRDRAVRVIWECARWVGVPVSAVVGPSRSKRPTMARHLAMYRLREEGFLWKQIGLALGGRDHATSIHGHLKIRMLQGGQGSGKIESAKGRITE